LRALYLVQPWRIDLSEHPVFISDEGVVGLMARHILAGARPVFYYGQYYLGALEAYCTAAVFRMLGESMTTLRLVPTLFAAGWIPLVGTIAARIYGTRAGLLAAALAALPSQFVFDWGFKARGGFAEHVALLLLLFCLLLPALERASNLRSAAIGFVAGLSLWVNQLAIAYLPIWVSALWLWAPLRRRHVWALVVAGCLGAAPLLYANAIEPLCTVRALITEARSSRRLQLAAQMSEGDRARDYRAVPLLEVLGPQSRRDGSWSFSGTATALLLLLGSSATFARAVRHRVQDPVRFRAHLLLFGFALATVFVGTAGFFGQPVGRYQLLLYPILCILAVGWLSRWSTRWATAITALCLFVQAVQLAMPPAGDRRTPAAAVAAALIDRDLRYGYSAGLMYDVVFQSRERVLIEPIERSRYAPYGRLVGRADRIFYVYRDDQEEKAVHRAVLARLENAGVRYRRLDIGEYHVLFDFIPADLLSADVVARIRRDVREAKSRDVSLR